MLNSGIPKCQDAVENIPHRHWEHSQHVHHIVYSASANIPLAAGASSYASHQSNLITERRHRCPPAPMREEDRNHQAVDQNRGRKKEAKAGREMPPSLRRRAVVPAGDIRFYASNTQQQERLKQWPTKECRLEYRRSRANQPSGNYSASI
ncbi:hypothetical protein MRX96_017500 [Rhipicephalus microplus]